MEVYTLAGEPIPTRPRNRSAHKLEKLLSPYAFAYFHWLNSKACFLSCEQKVIIELYRSTGTHTTAARDLCLKQSRVKTLFDDARYKLCFGVPSYRLWLGDLLLRQAGIKTNQSGFEIFLHSPVECLPIPCQLKNKFIENDFKTIYHVLKRPASALLSLRGFGPGLLNELKKVLEARGCLHLLSDQSNKTAI